MSRLKNEALLSVYKPVSCEWTVGVSPTGYIFCGGELGSHKNTCYCDEHRGMAYFVPSRESIDSDKKEIEEILKEEGEYFEEEIEI